MREGKLELTACGKGGYRNLGTRREVEWIPSEASTKCINGARWTAKHIQAKCSACQSRDSGHCQRQSQKASRLPGTELHQSHQERVCAHAGERGRTKESRLVAEASDHFGESRAPRIALVVTRSPPKKQQVSILPQTFPQLPAARLGLLEVCGWRCNRTPGRRGPGPGPGRGGAGGRAGAGWGGWAYKVLATPAAMQLSGAWTAGRDEQGAGGCLGPQVTEPPREGVPEDQAGLDLPAAGPASTSAPAHPQHVRPGAAWVGGMGAGVSAPLGSGVSSAGRIGSKFCQLWVSWLWLLVGVFAPGVLWTWVAEAESTLLENECLSLFAPGTLGILGAPARLACFCKSVLLASFF